MLDPPITCPRLFSAFEKPLAPPKLPRSIILPSGNSAVGGSHRNGSAGGSRVFGFGIVLVYEVPATSPRSLMNPAAASSPPSVPRSLILPHTLTLHGAFALCRVFTNDHPTS